VNIAALSEVWVNFFVVSFEKLDSLDDRLIEALNFSMQSKFQFHGINLDFLSPSRRVNSIQL
jgi:hypothetical protein